MKRSLLSLAFALIGLVAARPASAQNRACTDCGTQTCGPPMRQCSTECERPSIPPRSALAIQRCQEACQNRWVACVAVGCRACAGVYQAPAGVEPFPTRPGATDGPPGAVQVNPPAPTRGRVVTLRRR